MRYSIRATTQPRGTIQIFPSEPRILETLTAQTLGISGALYRTLRTTNPIENLIGSIAHFTRNVKRWKDGQMTLRWVAGALSDAKVRFRKLRGHRAVKLLLAEGTTRVENADAADLKADRQVASGHRVLPCIRST